VVSYLGNSVLYSTLLAPVLYSTDSTVPCTNLIFGLGGQQLLELVLGELAEEILLDLHLLPIPLLVVLPQVPGAAPTAVIIYVPGVLVMAAHCSGKYLSGHFQPKLLAKFYSQI